MAVMKGSKRGWGLRWGVRTMRAEQWRGGGDSGLWCPGKMLEAPTGLLSSVVSQGPREQDLALQEHLVWGQGPQHPPV